MRLLSRGRGALIVVLAVLGIAAAPKPKTFELRWTPNKNTKVAPTFDLTGGVRSVQMHPLEDRRNKGTQIGENLEEKQAVEIHTMSDRGWFRD